MTNTIEIKKTNKRVVKDIIEKEISNLKNQHVYSMLNKSVRYVVR